jgi:hypothetical protein
MWCGDEAVLVPANPAEREIVVTHRKVFSVLGKVWHLPPLAGTQQPLRQRLPGDEM